MIKITPEEFINKMYELIPNGACVEVKDAAIWLMENKNLIPEKETKNGSHNMAK